MEKENVFCMSDFRAQTPSSCIRLAQYLRHEPITCVCGVCAVKSQTPAEAKAEMLEILSSKIGAAGPQINFAELNSRVLEVSETGSALGVGAGTEFKPIADFSTSAFPEDHRETAIEMRERWNLFPEALAALENCYSALRFSTSAADRKAGQMAHDVLVKYLS